MNTDKEGTPSSGPSRSTSQVVHEKKPRGSRRDTQSMNKTIRKVLAPFFLKVKQKQSYISLQEKSDRSTIFLYKRKHDTLIKNIASYLQGTLELTALLQETAEVLHLATKSDDITLYLVNTESEEIYSLPKKNPTVTPSNSWSICEGSTVAAFVAFHKEYVMVDDVERDSRFPEKAGECSVNAKAVLCVPVVTPDGGIIAVMEFLNYRSENFTPFTMVDLQIVVSATGWLGAAVHQNMQRQALQVKQDENESLLELTRHYFSDIVPFETLVSRIVQCAKKMIRAERGSLFIVKNDQQTGELIAEVYEEGIDKDAGDRLYKKLLPLCLNSYPGIAAQVAKSRTTVVINDTFADPHYNRELDLLTGIITKSILCVPINARDNIIGVIQLVNKEGNGNFTSNDEKLLQTVALYCTLSLNYARIHNDVKITRVRNTVISEDLTIHYRPCIHDRRQMLACPNIQEVPAGFSKFGWYFSSYEEQAVQLLYFMITDLADKCFDEKTLCIFILTVKKCYRKNPYHNFEHAFTFTHCMYNILKKNTELFKPSENKSLVIASYCHDIDHRGFTNNFMQTSNSDLIQLYPESCMENHHFQTTMQIIQATKVYSGVTPEEYRDIVDEIHDAIISTDLALYFRCRPRLTSLLINNEFDWNITNHRVLVKSMMMTTCDLSGQCKPFPIAKRITESLYREFYHQGDLEKEMGLTPLSMMDREKQHTIPVDQMRFIDIVVLPCVDLLAQILPNTYELYTLARDLRNHWEEIIETRKSK